MIIKRNTLFLITLLLAMPAVHCANDTKKKENSQNRFVAFVKENADIIGGASILAFALIYYFYNKNKSKVSNPSGSTLKTPEQNRSTDLMARAIALEQMRQSGHWLNPEQIAGLCETINAVRNIEVNSQNVAQVVQEEQAIIATLNNRINLILELARIYQDLGEQERYNNLIREHRPTTPEQRAILTRLQSTDRPKYSMARNVGILNQLFGTTN
jgi:hypothetical protein